MAKQFPIRWTTPARQELVRIFDYLDAKNPVAAERTILRIEEDVQRLSNDALLGRPGRVKNTRELVISKTPYIVAYRLIHQIEILTIRHGARLWPSSFDQE